MWWKMLSDNVYQAMCTKLLFGLLFDVTCIVKVADAVTGAVRQCISRYVLHAAVRDGLDVVCMQLNNAYDM